MYFHQAFDLSNLIPGSGQGSKYRVEVRIVSILNTATSVLGSNILSAYVV